MQGNGNTRLRITVLFGGRSSEHEVSIMSATNVVGALDPAKYDVLPVFITREGRWLLSEFSDGSLATPEDGTELVLPAGGRGRALGLSPDGDVAELPRIDILFPVLHGVYGEDGTVQGFAATVGVPLVGCGVPGSATAMDKDIAKRLIAEAGLPTARSMTVHPHMVPDFAEVERTLGLPVFVKPACGGSSVGVSKVMSEENFAAAVEEGFRHGGKLLAEEFVEGREIEFAVLEMPDGALVVSRPGEIAPSGVHGFYSYDAKYVDQDGAALMVPAELPDGVEAMMRETAAKTFRALGCDGMARIDFFLRPDGRFVVNEVNTIPGFTDISMYSKAMAVSGIGYAEILDRLVEHGLARDSAANRTNSSLGKES
ncbi:MAG: D-alanine--D-alanine ligase A [Ahrensia sp.]|nr:D-alanine--D-alanine ligase A [Ahrensia sp.]|tara:strand:+ start:1746 stop:2855 length:1110 start_codon:yes stop_codon:yes gene_type:complete